MAVVVSDSENLRGMLPKLSGSVLGTRGAHVKLIEPSRVEPARYQTPRLLGSGERLPQGFVWMSFLG